ncbi:MAG: hypothetical protein ABI667_06640 [Sphingomicrobium sp.]
MSFLKTLLWILIAVLAIIFAGANWADVTIVLWGGLQVTIKLPFLLFLVALAVWLPTWLVMRGKLWRLERRLVVETQTLAVPPPPPAPNLQGDPAR